MPILPSQRHLFQVPSEVAYFNAAYYSPQLKESEARLLTAVSEKNRPWEKAAASFFEDVEKVRALASSLFGGDADGYAIVPAASYGLSTAARAIEPRLKTGDRILLIEEEFPSNVYPWRRTARETGAEIVTIANPADGDWANAIVGRIDDSVKVVAVSTCHWTNGAFMDLAPVARAARQAGALLVIDATQTFGAMPFDLAAIDPDFLVAAGYKWLLGPYGFGLLYVSERWRDARPLEESWLSRDNAEDFTSLARYSDGYMPGARRFDVGERCVPNLIPGALAALEHLQSWGIANIAETLAAINSQIADRLVSLGATLPLDSQRCPHMFGATLPAGSGGSLVADLKKRDVYISQRGSSLRFAPHLHVDDHDVARLLDALSELLA